MRADHLTGQIRIFLFFLKAPPIGMTFLKGGSQVSTFLLQLEVAVYCGTFDSNPSLFQSPNFLFSFLFFYFYFFFCVGLVGLYYFVLKFEKFSNGPSKKNGFFEDFTLFFLLSPNEKTPQKKKKIQPLKKKKL